MVAFRLFYFKDYLDPEFLKGLEVWNILDKGLGWIFYYRLWYLRHFFVLIFGAFICV